MIHQVEPFCIDKGVNKVTWMNHFNFQLSYVEINCSCIPLFSIHHWLYFYFRNIPTLVFLSWIMWGFPWEMFFILHLLFLILINTEIPITAMFLFSLKNFMNFKTFRELGDYEAVWIHKFYWLILIVWVKLYMAPIWSK